MSELTDNLIENISQTIEQAMEDFRVPGVALGITSLDRVETRHFGVTNQDHPLSVTDETIFQIGSISKTFLGTALLAMAEQGALSVDEPIRLWLPDM